MVNAESESVKKKILILASWYPSEASPVAGIFVHDQAMALARDYQVAVIAPRIAGWRELLNKKIDAASLTEGRTELPVYRERVRSLVPRHPELAYPRWQGAAQRGFAKLLREWGMPDLIHAHVVLPAGWSAVALGKEHSRPVVLTEHSSPFAMHLRTRPQQRWVRKTLEQVHRVIAVSPALANQIQAFHQGASMNVIGNLIKTEFFVPAPNQSARHGESKTRFLSIALLTKQKGLIYLLQAAKLLLERNIMSFELIIGGDGPERATLERLALSLRISGRCRFLGLLNPNQVRAWMQQGDVFVMPSLHESFGIALAEAMACGKPVIATRCGGPEFVVTPDTGVLVNVADPSALAAAMEDFITARKKYHPTVVRKSVVERFGEETFLRQITAIYEQVW